MHTIFLRFLAEIVAVATPCRAVADDLRHDFHYFLAGPDAVPTFRVVHRPERGPARRWRSLLQLRRTRYHIAPRGARRVALFDRAWVDYRFDEGRAFVFCGEPELAYEACMQVVQSLVGERLGARGVHRIHALGLAFDGLGALLLGASGTGKSSLLLDLLRGVGPEVLSDDTPLVAASAGRCAVHAYPQRLATRERPEGFAPEQVRRFRRVRYGEKFVVSAAAFAERIVDRAPARWLVLLSRRGARTPRLVAVRRRRLVWPLVRWLVVGHETPQVVELFVRFSPRDVAKRFGILGSRLRVAAALLRTTETFTLELGTDRRANAALVRDLPRAALLALARRRAGAHDHGATGLQAHDLVGEAQERRAVRREQHGDAAFEAG
jgi:hypothetical protein